MSEQATVSLPSETKTPPGGFSRRSLLIGGGAAAVGWLTVPWLKDLFTRPQPVFLAGNQRYDGPLAATIREGLLATGFEPAGIRGRKVLLKPNLVEPTVEAPHMTTNPAVVVAAAEVFRGWSAEVMVGEAPGHMRDTQHVLDASGVGEALRSEELPFADLNYQEFRLVENVAGASPLEGICFPRGVLEADLIVSLPKLKTHHWQGMTCAMKNLYGTLPGIRYGWPKNVLHHAGIPQTVVDINASLPRTIAVVDAIECMEGDGPILGTPKQMGMIAVGMNLPALDATCARIMGLRPERIGYLELAQLHGLGSIQERHVVQRGEEWRTLADPFEILNVDFLQFMRADHA